MTINVKCVICGKIFECEPTDTKNLLDHLRTCHRDTFPPKSAECSKTTIKRSAQSTHSTQSEPEDPDLDKLALCKLKKIEKLRKASPKVKKQVEGSCQCKDKEKKRKSWGFTKTVEGDISSLFIQSNKCNVNKDEECIDRLEPKDIVLDFDESECPNDKETQLRYHASLLAQSFVKNICTAKDTDRKYCDDPNCYCNVEKKESSKVDDSLNSVERSKGGTQDLGGKETILKDKLLELQNLKDSIATGLWNIENKMNNEDNSDLRKPNETNLNNVILTEEFQELKKALQQDISNELKGVSKEDDIIKVLKDIQKRPIKKRTQSNDKNLETEFSELKILEQIKNDIVEEQMEKLAGNRIQQLRNDAISRLEKSKQRLTDISNELQTFSKIELASSGNVSSVLEKSNENIEPASTNTDTNLAKKVLLERSGSENSTSSLELRLALAQKRLSQNIDSSNKYLQDKELKLLEEETDKEKHTRSSHDKISILSLNSKTESKKIDRNLHKHSKRKRAKSGMEVELDTSRNQNINAKKIEGNEVEIEDEMKLVGKETIEDGYKFNRDEESATEVDSSRINREQSKFLKKKSMLENELARVEAEEAKYTEKILNEEKRLKLNGKSNGLKIRSRSGADIYKTESASRKSHKKDLKKKNLEKELADEIKSIQNPIELEKNAKKSKSSILQNKLDQVEQLLAEGHNLVYEEKYLLKELCGPGKDPIKNGHNKCDESENFENNGKCGKWKNEIERIEEQLHDLKKIASIERNYLNELESAKNKKSVLNSVKRKDSGGSKGSKNTEKNVDVIQLHKEVKNKNCKVKREHVMKKETPDLSECELSKYAKPKNSNSEIEGTKKGSSSRIISNLPQAKQTCNLYTAFSCNICAEEVIKEMKAKQEAQKCFKTDEKQEAEDGERNKSSKILETAKCVGKRLSAILNKRMGSGFDPLDEMDQVSSKIKINENDDSKISVKINNSDNSIYKHQSNSLTADHKFKKNRSDTDLKNVIRSQISEFDNLTNYNGNIENKSERKLLLNTSNSFNKTNSTESHKTNKDKSGYYYLYEKREMDEYVYKPECNDAKKTMSMTTSNDITTTCSISKKIQNLSGANKIFESPSKKINATRLEGGIQVEVYPYSSCPRSQCESDCNTMESESHKKDSIEDDDNEIHDCSVEPTNQKTSSRCLSVSLGSELSAGDVKTAVKEKSALKKPKSKYYRTTIQKSEKGKGSRLCPNCKNDAIPIIKSTCERISSNGLGAACILTFWPCAYMSCSATHQTKHYLYCSKCNYFLGVSDPKKPENDIKNQKKQIK